MLGQHAIIIDTSTPCQTHVLWLSDRAPFATGHKAVITDQDADKPVLARSMKLNLTYDVQIYNRKKEWVDAFEITYAYSKFYNKPIIVKQLGHY